MPCVCAAVNHLSTDFAAMETWLKCLVLSLAWTASALVARARRPSMAAALRRSSRHDRNSQVQARRHIDGRDADRPDDRTCRSH